MLTDADKDIMMTGRELTVYGEKPTSSCTGRSRCSVFTVRMEPTLVHCTGCGKDILNIDGCPDCGTTRYLTHGHNQ